MIESPDFASSVETAVGPWPMSLTTLTLTQCQLLSTAMIWLIPLVWAAWAYIPSSPSTKWNMAHQNQLNWLKPTSMPLNYYTLVASNKIAKERGKSFDNFEGILSTRRVSTSMLIKHLSKWPLKGCSYHEQRWPCQRQMTGVPSKEAVAWQSTTKTVWPLPQPALSPMSAETSASLHPITRLIEERQEKKTRKTYYPAPMLSMRPAVL